EKRGLESEPRQRRMAHPARAGGRRRHPSPVRPYDGPPTFLMTKSRYRGLLRTQPTHLRGEAGRPASTYAAATHPNTHGGGCPGRSSGHPLIAPHAPGEDISAVDGTVTVTGSPPRVLGAPANRWSAESTAHPHVRGEDLPRSFT